VVRRDGQLAYVLTADHVLAVEAGREPVIETFTTKSTPFPNAKATSVAILERMPEVDLAILRIELSNPPAALRICPKNEAARLESPTEQRPVPVLTSGIGGGFDSPFLRRDRVIGLRQAKPGSPAWFFEAETAPVAGRSGGPLVDERGYLIGICSGTRGGKGYYISVGEIHTALEPKKLGWLVDGKPNH
jgi:S1-C subfamily serine protease